MNATLCDPPLMLQSGVEVPASAVRRVLSVLPSLSLDALVHLAAKAADPTHPVPAGYLQQFADRGLIHADDLLDYDMATVIREALVGNDEEYTIVNPCQR